MKKIMLVFGTRPEAIKLVPVYLELIKYADKFEVRICVTGQHRHMLDQVLNLYNIHPDFDLDIMKNGQDLYDITTAVLLGMRKILKEYRPDILIVHGDTTTTMAGCIAGFYEKVSVAHVEAGLRTGNLFAPWPEEFNRKVAGLICKYHFAPTELAKQNLLREGVQENSIFVTGNTVIDALLTTAEKIQNDEAILGSLQEKFSYFSRDRKIILLTGHRRENFGKGFDNIFSAIKKILVRNPSVDIIYPVHLNPNVRDPARSILANEIEMNRVILIEPQDYMSFVYLMKKSDLIITDSGGVQEEAPSFRVPVLVTRDATERPEAIAAGCAILVGTDIDRIVNQAEFLLHVSKSQKEYPTNPYGDGYASKRICNVLLESKMSF